MLVKNVDQIREAIAVNATSQFETYQPYIAAVERQIIMPVLGVALFNVLDALTDLTATAKQKELLTLVRYAQINLAMWKGFDMLNVTFDDSGFQRNSEKKAIYRSQEEALRNGFKNEGYNGIDAFIEYLQANIADFEAFKTSTFYIDAKGRFFPTTSVFNEIYNIGNSALVFVQISRFFNQVIDFQIKPLLGEILYDKVIAEMKKETAQDADLMALVPYIRKPLAFLSVGIGIDELGMQMTERGMFWETQFPTMQSHIQTALLSVDQTKMLHDKAMMNGNRYKEVLLDYLKTNAAKYPDFTQTELTSTNIYRRDNTGKRTFFA